jgi:hypothetical protein
MTSELTIAIDSALQLEEERQRLPPQEQQQQEEEHEQEQQSIAASGLNSFDADDVEGGQFYPEFLFRYSEISQS